MSANPSRKQRPDNEEQSGHGGQSSPASLSQETPFTLVIKQKLPGIYVQPSYKSALMWFGVIFIRDGLYQDGVFKFTVYIPDNYPDGQCPKLVFDIPVFHPLVDPVSGELDVRRAFTKWRRNHNHICKVSMYARTVFYKINTAEPLNPEAAVLKFGPRKGELVHHHGYIGVERDLSLVKDDLIMGSMSRRAILLPLRKNDESVL
uniref:UBC core domain-containing protein n=1 Tax=Oryzias latipes TaxID=8090 RepID=A0A3P9L2N2_ORYLA